MDVAKFRILPQKSWRNVHPSPVRQGTKLQCICRALHAIVGVGEYVHYLDNGSPTPRCAVSILQARLDFTIVPIK